jgi:putative ABC transport system permease protein
MVSASLTIIGRSLLHRKLRAVLTAIGIVIGIAVVVALMLLSRGLQDAVTAQLRQFGSDLLIAVPGDVSNPVAALAGRGTFRERDIEAVSGVPGVAAVMPTFEGRLVTGEFKGEKKLVSLHAQRWALIKSIFEESQGFKIADGRWPAKEDDREVVLGANFAEEAFKRSVAVGDVLALRGRQFVVSGILASTGEQNHDNSVFISIEMARRVTGERDNYSVMIVKAEPGRELAALADDVSAVLAGQKGLEDFSVITPDKAAAAVSNIIGVVELILSLIAVVAVGVGGIGIMNTMYTSVLERTRDIGIMKAVGATRRKILSLFVLESGALGLLGGAVGLAGGAGLAKAVAALARQRGFRALIIDLDAGMMLAVLSAALAVGAIAGVLPARQAAGLKPADALKYR